MSTSPIAVPDAPAGPGASARLSRQALVPLANVEAIGESGLRWRAVNNDPQFEVAGAAALAGRWAMLDLVVALDGEPLFPIMLYPDLGAGLSEALALRLYADSAGRASYAWKVPPTLRGLRFDPVAQPGIFEIREFRLEARSTASICVSAAWRVAQEASRTLGRGAAAAVQAWRRDGLSAVVGALASAHNSDARQGRADRVRGHAARLEILERHVAMQYLRASQQTHWGTQRVEGSSDSVDPDALPLTLVAHHVAPRRSEGADWSDVAAAQPQFIGHHQPHLPETSGSAAQPAAPDLRSQVAAARRHGIGAFCFHQRAGERMYPGLEQFLADPSLHLRFCVRWEPPARRAGTPETAGADAGPAADADLPAVLGRTFADSRCLRVDGKPLVVVGCADRLANAAASIAAWRARALEIGLPGLYLAAEQAPGADDPRQRGFDAAVIWPPDARTQAARPQPQIVNPDFRGRIFDYAAMVAASAVPQPASFPVFASVLPCWDDEPCNPGAGRSYAGATPQAYAGWLHAAGNAAMRRPAGERLLFVHAWNDWSNGAHLEPDRHFGHAWLHATANALHAFAAPAPSRLVDELNREFRRSSDLAVIVHLYYEDLIEPVFSRHIEPLAGLADVFVTLRPGTPASQLHDMRRRFPATYFISAENRGRDVRPFLLALRRVHEMGYRLACKVHGKKSPHLADGAAQREYLIGTLLGGPDRVAAIRRAFDADPRLGLAYPARARTALSEHAIHAGNTRWLDILLARLGRADEAGRYGFDFPAGSMYWFRVAALLPLLEHGIVSPDEFELESGQLDGTLAHAIERLILVVSTRAGFSALPL